MKLKILKTKSDYEKALHRIDTIFDAKLNTTKGDEFELLSLLIDKYEEEHYPIDLHQKLHIPLDSLISDYETIPRRS